MFPIFVRKKLILSILQKQKEGNLTDFPSYAESEGFEPPVRRNAYTAFRVRLFRPLRQLSNNSISFLRTPLAVISFRKRLQRYCFFFKPPNVLRIFSYFSCFLHALQQKSPLSCTKLLILKEKFWLFAKKAVLLRPQAAKTACIVLKMASFDALILAILNVVVQ